MDGNSIDDPDGSHGGAAMGSGESGESGFDAVLHYLKESRGFDFTGYKRTSLMRRVRRRMDQVGMAGYVRSTSTTSRSTRTSSRRCSTRC